MLCIMLIPNSHDGLITAVAIIGQFFVTMAYGIIYIYTNELFPTVIRATGMGTCGMLSRDISISEEKFSIIILIKYFIEANIKLN